MISRQTPLKEVLQYGEKCKRCGRCCSHGGGFVLEEDLKRIADHLGITKEELIEKYLDEKISYNTKHYKLKQKDYPYGPCIFLEGKECKINEVKPLHCRIGNCSKVGQELSIWFVLNYFVDPDDPESVRQWAQYLKTHPTIPGGYLKELVPDQERLRKILNYEILK